MLLLLQLHCDKPVFYIHKRYISDVHKENKLRCTLHYAKCGIESISDNEHTLIFYPCESNQRFLTSSCFLSVFISVACASILAAILPLS